MKKWIPSLLLIAISVSWSAKAVAQEADSTQTATVITLEDALKIALSENASVMPRKVLMHLYFHRLT